MPELGRQLRLFRRAGLALVLLTGVLLFWIEPVKCFRSVPFRIKLASFFVLAVSPPLRTRLTTILWWALWLAIIFASRWIGYF